MLTKKEVEQKGLQEGKDYIYLGKVRYREGDRFICKEEELSVRRIIDSHHFIATHGESWHTGMFDDLNCCYGHNMIPLEFNERMFEKAEERLRHHQIFHTELFVLQDGKIQEEGTFLARYNHNHDDYRAEIDGKISRDFCSLQAAIGLLCPEYAEELRCIVQEWGVSGEEMRGILLDNGKERILYEGIEHTPVAFGKVQNEGTTIAVLKRICSPAQHYSFVRNFSMKESGEYGGETMDELSDFIDVAEWFEEITGKAIQDGVTAMRDLIQNGGNRYEKAMEL